MRTPRLTLALAAATAMIVSGCLGTVRIDAADADADDWVARFGAAVPPGTYRFENFARVVDPGVFEMLPFVKTFVPSALDGVAIEIGYWRPDVPDDVQVPIIVDAGPYYGNDGAPMENRGGHLLRLTENFVAHGFAVAAVSARGTGQSGGCMDLMGPNEVADLSQAITWLAEQPWSNGNVGMIGLSYDGSTPWMVARTGNPHLKTIVPVSGVPDVYELMFRNGSAEIRGAFLLNALYYSYAVAKTQVPPPETPEEAARYAERAVQGAACPDHAVGMAAALHAGATGERDPFGYWAARNAKPDVEANYQGSVLLVQGLQDWNVDPGLNLPWADELDRAGITVHQFLGQWGHSYPDTRGGQPESPNQRWDWAEILLNWFTHWLKEDASVPLGPPVQVLDTHGNWRVDTSWPPRDATWTTHHLASGGQLAPEPGGAGEVRLVPQAWGRTPLGDIEDLPGRVADFVLPVESDLRIAGLPRVHVTVTPDGPGGHLAAWLYDVDPSGEATPIGWTMMNLRFHEGGQEARDVQPGQPLVAMMEIQPLEAVVEAGHTLLLRVWQHRDDLPGQEVQGRYPTAPVGPVTLHYGGDVRSVLELPTIERGPGWFIEPPRPEP